MVPGPSTTGIVTGWIKDLSGVDIWNHGFTLYSAYGVFFVYMYFQIPFMVLVILPALEGLRSAWREAAQNLGASSWQYWRYAGGRIPAELQGSGTVAVLGGTVPVKGGQSQTEALGGGTAVDALVRPEGLTMQVAENGNGIVTHRTFLGSVTRVRVLLSGDVTVQIDRPSSEAAALAPGTPVSVILPPEPVLIAPAGYLVT